MLHKQKDPPKRVFLHCFERSLLLDVFCSGVGLVGNVLRSVGSRLGSIGGRFGSGSGGGIGSLLDVGADFGNGFAGGSGSGVDAFSGGGTGSFSSGFSLVASDFRGGSGFSGFALGGGGFILASRESEDAGGQEDVKLGVHDVLRRSCLK
jgi:hypothetical protein